MKIVFMGTPDFAVPVLEAIVSDGHEVVQVYSQPPRAAGRGQRQRKTPVHLCAEHLGLQVATPQSLKSGEEIERLTALGAEAGVVVAYGLILPQAALDAPHRGCFNLHASLLPRWRGAAPIQRAIMAGDTMSGVCVMKMTAGLDEGPVCLRREVAITEQTTAGDLHDGLAQAGAKLVCEALNRLAAGALTCVSQDEHGVTHANKISKAEAQIDFTANASDVVRHIHGLSPFPGAWFMAPTPGGGSVRIKVLRCEIAEGSGAPGKVLDDKLTIACGTGAVRPCELQREGRGAMPADLFVRGVSIAPGTVIARN